jgi:hypothetical protein
MFPSFALNCAQARGPVSAESAGKIMASARVDEGE